MNHYGLGDIGFGQIQGVAKGGGGQDLSTLITGLFSTLRDAGYFGTEASSESKSLADLGLGKYTDPNQSLLGGSDVPYTLEGLMGQLEQDFGEGVFNVDPNKWRSEGWETQQGMQSLLELLKNVNLPGMQKEYGQQLGDVGAEIGAQMGELTSGFTRGGKGSRYSGLASSKKNLGQGGRAQYLSDYYGLQEKEFGMQRDLQKQMEEDLYGEVGQYMQLNPYNVPSEV